MEFHNMTPEEQLFVVTMEECAELTQACSKILRFGKDPESLARLQQELGDVMCMISLCMKKGLIDPAQLEANAEFKLKKLSMWSNILEDSS